MRPHTVITVCLVGIIAFGFFSVQPLVRDFAVAAAGYTSKFGCSSVFISGRSLQQLNAAEFSWPPVEFLHSLDVDLENRCFQACSKLWWSICRISCYRSEKLGCVLLSSEDWLGEGTKRVIPPHGGSYVIPDDLKSGDFHVSVDPNKPWPLAFLVVKDGELVYERYGDGADEETPLIGWSMTKSVLNALYGCRVAEGKVSLEEAVALHLCDSDGENDGAGGRGGATVRDALQMRSGFGMHETYRPGADVTQMLFTAADAAAYVCDKDPLRRDGPRCWQYCSGTSNVLSHHLRRSFLQDEDDEEAAFQAYLRYPFEALFRKQLIDSMVMETDASGTFLASSFSWATGRDWARFGLLYADGGKAVSSGEQLLPPEWVAFSSSPAATSRNFYGAHFWLGGRPFSEADAPADERALLEECDGIYPARQDGGRHEWLRSLPPDSFFASGFDDQFVIISPRHNAVVVRLGATKEQWDRAAFFQTIFGALE